MLLRRDVVAGGLLTLIWAAGSCSCSAQARSQRHAVGCLIGDGEADILLARNDTHIYSTPGNDTIIPNSGDRYFDFALAQALLKMTQIFDVRPGVAFYDDHPSANAYFNRIARLQGSDGTVLFGLELLRRYKTNYKDWDVAVVATLAHEYAHAAQFKHGLLGQLPTKRLELHADYLAGFFSGVRKREKRDFPAEIFVQSLSDAGDFEFDDPRHHGMPSERAAATVQGFEAAYIHRRSFSDALQTGVSYVQNL